MENLKKLLGENLLLEIREKIGDVQVIIDDGKLIPKHRFDCINISLKEHKEKLKECQAKLAATLADSEMLESLKRENIALKLLAKNRAKNILAAMNLLDIRTCSLPELETDLTKQIKKLKRTDDYLFDMDGGLYRLVPYQKGKIQPD